MGVELHLIKEPEPTPKLPDHLARAGEPEYAVICRQRSGIESGRMDYVLPVQRIESLCPADKRDLLSTAEAMLERLREYCAT